jgi:hypothetical protein
MGAGTGRLAVWLVVMTVGVMAAGCGGGQADSRFAAAPLAPVPFGRDADALTGGPVHVTVIGDSVASAIAESPEAEEELNRGMRATLDLRACRRLDGVSCTFAGSTPPAALQAVEDRGNRLGSVLVVDVGYNDEADGYAAAMDRIVRAARARGVKRVVWVTLREAGPAPGTYRATNAQIREAAQRWPELRVADWNGYSAGKPWFGGDGMHLSPEGGVALARFLRPYITGAS